MTSIERRNILEAGTATLRSDFDNELIVPLGLYAGLNEAQYEVMAPPVKQLYGRLDRFLEKVYAAVSARQRSLQTLEGSVVYSPMEIRNKAVVMQVGHLAVVNMPAARHSKRPLQLRTYMSTDRTRRGIEIAVPLDASQAGDNLLLSSERTSSIPTRSGSVRETVVRMVQAPANMTTLSQSMPSLNLQPYDESSPIFTALRDEHEDYERAPDPTLPHYHGLSGFRSDAPVSEQNAWPIEETHPPRPYLMNAISQVVGINMLLEGVGSKL